MDSIYQLASTPIRQLIQSAESHTRLVMKNLMLEPEGREPTLFGAPPRPPVWPERHPFHWLDRAEKGDAEAMLKLGTIYERSEETGKALQWYQKTAQAGNAEGKKKLEALEGKIRSEPASVPPAAK